MKSLLLGLFLYVALVWVGGAYLYTGPQIIDFGLKWTAIGLIVLLLCIIGVRLWSWWGLMRAKSAGRPAAPKKPSEPVHEDDAALETLLAEAAATLAKAPAFAGKRGRPLSGLPLYLLIGPENSGKTSTFINAGLEAQLLAGRVTGTSPVVPTRLCNIWFAKEAIFVEMGGRSFTGDLGRWTQLLRGLRGQSSLPLWRRLLTEPDQGMALHGVIGFCEATEFTGSANPERLDQNGRDWHERLRAIGEVFGVEFPVYQVITKCDGISFFSDFFKRLPDTEANQVLGCTLPFRRATDSQPGQVFAEAEGKRLTKSFNPLYYALSGRRLTHLAHEPDPARRPQIYEFPREFKRIRSPLVEFLNALSRPDPLRPGPLLRGYYLTGVREVESSALPDPGASRADWAPATLASDATQMFRGDATQIFRAEGGKAQLGGRGMLTRRWIFAADLFHSVILADRRGKVATAADPSLDVYRMAALGVACGVCALLCFAFLWSWTGNRALMKALPAPGAGGLVAQLQSLDALRGQVETLTNYERNGAPWSLRWGFYSGGKIVEDARKAYFRRFQQLLLNDLNGTMVARLQSLPQTPQASDPYEPANSVLKAHLMISSGSCKADPAFAARILKNVRQEIPPLATPEVRALADRQIEYYASELAYENPVRVKEDIPARDRARQYLRKITGVEKVYSGIIANAEKALTKTQKLGDLASNYSQVLSGPAEMSAVYTPEGWAYVEKAAKEGNAGASADSCVLGELPGVAGEWKRDAETEKAIQTLYVRDYVDRWKKFLAGLSVTRFNGAEDAAKRLDILASHKSPLLAIFAMTANSTNFQLTTPAVPEGLEKVPILNKIISSVKETKKTADKVVEAVSAPPTDTLTTTSDITRSFQPVHWVVPPRSETWVVEKNTAYIESLAQLRRSMEEISRGGPNPDPAVHQAAGQNRVKAMDAVRQITIGFKSIGVLGIDTEVQRLLEEPINLTKNYIIADMSKAAEGKLNAELRVFCERFRPFLRKYPFQPTGEDATLVDLASWFAPGTGAVWKMQAQTLGDLTVKDGPQWKAKDPARKPQVTPEVLNFLNRAQQLTDAFFAGGSPQPHFNYTLRPRLDPSFGNSTVEFDIDGQVHQWTISVQHQFSWPAPPGAKESGGRARTKGAFSLPFASRGGLWGIFKIMGDAEPRENLTKTVEWKYLRPGDGRKEPIEPAPVRLDIVEFPGGVDIFNPKFFQGLQCPMRATQ